jgi:hypothetical protein
VSRSDAPADEQHAAGPVRDVRAAAQGGVTGDHIRFFRDFEGLQALGSGADHSVQHLLVPAVTSVE